jgi:hypothetical protein
MFILHWLLPPKIVVDCHLKSFDVATQVFGHKNNFDNTITFNGDHVEPSIMSYPGVF